MRVFLAISCLAALAAARPDVSHLGYDYHSAFSGTTVGPTVVAKSNGIAVDATLAPTVAPLGVTTTIAPTIAPLGLTSTVAPALGYQADSLLSSTALPLGYQADSLLSSTALPLGFGGAFGSGFGSGFSSGFSSGFDSLAATAIPSTIAPLGITAAPTALSTFGLDATAIPSTLAPLGLGINSFGYSGASAAGYIHHQTPVVSKHFYGYSAPEEAREEYHRHLVLGTPQKNYRVVFIKAPSSQTATRISASFAPTEEKTVIYVLSKKPEDLQINDIQAPPPTEPSKPEVFFIKYKTPEEAAHAQQQIQAQYDALGGYTQASDEGVAPLTSVIGSLGQSISEVDIANARFDTVHAPVQVSTPLAAGAIHHVGSPLSTVAPAFDALSIGGLTSTIAPAFNSFGADALSLSTLAPAVSTIAPYISTLAPAVSTLAPAVSTIAPAISTVEPAISIGDKYLPSRKA